MTDIETEKETIIEQAQTEKEIKNRAKYFQVLLLSSIEEYSANSIYKCKNGCYFIKG